jgi:hypothetical protein
MKELAGLIMLAASVGAFWFFLPRDGKPHWLLNQPTLSSIIPLTIVIGIALGGAMAASVFGR